MNRRDFLKRLIAVPLAARIDFNQPIPGTWGAITRSTTPLFNSSYTGPGYPLTLPMLYGIPYHQSNASTSSWLGFSRVTSPSTERAIRDLTKEDYSLV